MGQKRISFRLDTGVILDTFINCCHPVISQLQERDETALKKNKNQISKLQKPFPVGEAFSRAPMVVALALICRDYSVSRG